MTARRTVHEHVDAAETNLTLAANEDLTAAGRAAYAALARSHVEAAKLLLQLRQADQPPHPTVVRG